jgi:hypothetical protein
MGKREKLNWKKSKKKVKEKKRDGTGKLKKKESPYWSLCFVFCVICIVRVVYIGFLNGAVREAGYYNIICACSVQY